MVKSSVLLGISSLALIMSGIFKTQNAYSSWVEASVPILFNSGIGALNLTLLISSISERLNLKKLIKQNII